MDTPTPAFPTLQNQQFMNLATFRKNGAKVVTPVWFAQEGATLFVMSQAETGKVKRLRANPAVEIAPASRRGEPLGPAEPARGRLLGPAEAAHADAMLNAKYGFMKKLFDLMFTLRGSKNQRVFLAITPAQGETV